MATDLRTTQSLKRAEKMALGVNLVVKSIIKGKKWRVKMKRILGIASSFAGAIAIPA